MADLSPMEDTAVFPKPTRTLMTVALIFALCVVMNPTAPGSAQAATGDVGTAAPEFDLLIFQGGGATQSLSDLSGKVVMLFIVGYS